MSELDAFRAEKDEFFREHPQSPLTREQKRRFEGLQYFPENEALRLEVQVERLFDQQPIQMQTSTGGVQTYVINDDPDTGALELIPVDDATP